MLSDPVIAQITEPMTMLTDYALAALAAAFVVRLRLKAGSSGAASIGWWRLAFAVTALAALAGGTAHGFRLFLGEPLHTRVWLLTVVSIAMSAALMLVAAIRSILWPSIGPGPRRKAAHQWLKRGLYVTLGGAAIVLGGRGLHQHFNHNDLYHVVQMAGLYCLYRGSLALEGLDSNAQG
ncbi:MAG: hypothetical protein WD733_24705 [Bryobacterales bacterium]